jgi:hypothetical protein
MASWHSMAGSGSCGKGLDVEAGSGARALEACFGMVCGCLTYAIIITVDAPLFSTLFPACLCQACLPRPKSCGLPYIAQRYSKPVMRSVCSNLVQLSIPIWRRREVSEASKAYGHLLLILFPGSPSSARNMFMTYSTNQRIT